nr:PD-(D/E)XK nuclease domain-containing protein [uncultured Acetatifactor sp.]
MGAYLNPGNSGYQEILQSEYVDKTGLIALINNTVGTREKLSCISRPRRFGKSYAAMMLCESYGMDFGDAKNWYDGYDFPDIGAIYNPYSVMLAMRKRKFGSYWQKTSAAESLMTYINMDFEGLQETISRLISGEEVEVDTDLFENDFESFKSCDDVLTLLIHLGYLTWHEEEGTVRIPNEEVRIEFRKILKGTNVNRKWMELLGRSEKLLEDTIAGDAEAVAKAVEEIRDSQYAPTYYNDEQALRYVIKFAYIAALDQYLKVEELPSGKGIADVVYLPKRRSAFPALVVELKWNKSSEGAIRQVKERNYPAVLKDYGGEIVLVGIAYDAKKTHSCVIERI